MLLDALRGPDRGRLTGAAFVAGRCSTGDSDDDAKTTAQLRTLIDSFNPAELRAAAEIYVEAVMSLALGGRADEARSLLTALVTVPENDSIAGYLAAYYLAQLGDPVGYPILHAELHDEDNPHGRMMATRHLIAFVPYDGTAVGPLTIDVRGEYRQRLRDVDSDVVDEVPDLMMETGMPDIIDDVRAAAQSPYPQAARAAAQRTLDGR